MNGPALVDDSDTVRVSARLLYRKKVGRGLSRETFALVIDAPTEAELREKLAEAKARRGINIDSVMRAKIHVCAACGKRGGWTDTWGWYGSYLDLDDEKPIVKTCSDACFALAKRKKLIPRNASNKPTDLPGTSPDYASRYAFDPF